MGLRRAAGRRPEGAYRRRHHLHHRHTQTPEDPDLPLSAPLPVSPDAWRGPLLGDLVGWTGAHAARPTGAPEVTASPDLAALPGSPHRHATLCPSSPRSGLDRSPLMWVLPWPRGFSSHADPGSRRARARVHAADPLQQHRTIGRRFLARALAAPYGVNYTRASPARIRALLEAPRGPGAVARQGPGRAMGGRRATRRCSPAVTTAKA